MSRTYRIIRDADCILRIGFGEPSDNDQIVKDTVARLDTMMETDELITHPSGGGLLKVNGPARSLPVAMVLGYQLSPFRVCKKLYDPLV